MKSSRTQIHSLFCSTRQVWQPRLGRDLSSEDARQIIENVTGFFSLIAEWSRAEMKASASDTSKSVAFAVGEPHHVR